MRRGWWVKALLLVFVLPWAVPALPTFISIHWMLNGEWGLLNNFLYNVFGIEGPGWLDTSRWLALGRGHRLAHLEVDAVLDRDPAGRPDGDPAGALRGGRGRRRHRACAGFVHVTFPLLANLYLICTLLSTIFTLGDFNSVYLRLGRRAGAFRPMCWRRSASATPSRSRSRGSAWRR